jgi:uncharacterized iron-regulated protein
MHAGTRDEQATCHMMIKLGLAYLFSFSVAFAAMSCDAADRAYDCNQICNKYKDCADANYDASACTSECRDKAANSEAYEDQADACQACIDDRSCVGAAFGCGSECAAIVP